MTEENAVRAFRKHLFSVVISRKMKANSKVICDNNKEIASYCCFDLQQVLECPYTNIGDAFYKRQLSCYNFVVNDEATKTGHCFFWSEIDGNRGSNEMATNLLRYAQRKAETGTLSIMAYADGCGGQNRNRIMAAVCNYIVTETLIESIEVCYFVKGHTENSADTVHSMIEGAKVSNVQLPSEWPVIFRNIDSKELTLRVTEMKYTDFIDLKAWMTSFPNWYRDAEGETIINWMTVKLFRFMKDKPHVMFFKNSYHEKEYQQIDLLQTGGKRKIKRKSPTSLPSLKPAYLERLPLAPAKYADLQSMCASQIIDRVHHDFYKNLPHD